MERKPSAQRTSKAQRVLTALAAGKQVRPEDLTAALADLQAASEHAQAQEAELRACRDSARALDAMMRYSYGALVLLDRDFNFLRVNEAYAKSCGRPVEEFPGLNHFDLYPSEEMEGVFRQVVQSGRPWSIEARPFEFPDHPDWGTSYWDLSVSPLLDEAGQVESLLFSLKDVSERVRAEQELERYRQSLEAQVAARTEELRLSEERYRTIADHTWDWEMWTRTDDSIAYVSPSVERITGYSQAEIADRPELLLEMVHPEDLERVVAHGQEARTNAVPRELEYRIVRRDGEILWIHHICTPVYGADGSPLGLRITNRDLTAQKAAEAGRERERALFTAVLEQAPVGIITAEAPSGRLVIVNEQLRRIWRETEFDAHSVQESAGYPCFCLTGEPLSLEQLPLWRALTQGEVVTEEEYNIQRGDGTWATLSANAAPIHNEEGAIEAAVVALTDVTNRKVIEAELARYREFLEELVAERTAEVLRTQEALREEGDFITAVLQTAPALIVVLDATGRIVRVNRACEELTGHRMEESRGRLVWELVARPEEARRLHGVFAHGIAQAPASWESHLRRHDGEERLVSWKNSVLRDAAERVQFVIATGLDLTEQHQMEAALRESEEKYRQLVEGAGVMVLRVDTAGQITFANDHAERFFGYAPEELLGRDLSVLTPPRESPGRDRRARLPDLWADPDAYPQMEGESLTRDGRPVWVFWSNRALRDETGAVVGMTSVGTDRTEQHRAEELLLSYQATLRSLASELALAEERARRRIATGIHDHISQSLALSKLKLGVLGQTCPPDAAPLLQELTALTDTVIGYTRTLTFELAPPVLYEVGFVPALEWLAEHAHAVYGFTCRIDDDGQRKPLADDLRAMLFESVRELFANAAKYAGATEVIVRVTREGGGIQVLVDDNGVGFDPSRLAETASRSEGFGLFNIGERLRLLGGSLEVESSPGHGTRVTLSAPLQVTDEPETAD
ncbi:MAG TPA: PAS domain S-box protein [Armatimonadota bacterium]|jgi:PAS domain S-box-containing protein